MKKIQDLAAFLFLGAVSVLTVVSILGVWKILNKDVITKSFETLGLLIFVTVIVLVAGSFFGKKSEDPGQVAPLPNAAFKEVRSIVITLLIISASLLALLGVLAIWEVISDKEVISRSLASLGILTFSSFIMVLTCVEREGSKFMTRKISGGGIIAVLFLGWLLFSVFGRGWW